MQPIEMALEAALIVMQHGGSTVAADRTFTNILTGYKQEGVSAAWRLDFIAATGGDWGSLAIAFVAVGVGQFLRSLLQARRLAVAPVTLICGVLSACIASVGLRLGCSRVVPATLIASVIYMLPGLPLINGFVDLVSHKYLLVGIERIINAAFLFLVLAIAIALAYTVIL